MVLVKPDELEELSTKILLSVGASPENALLVARHLVDANLSGVDTHGVYHLPTYVRDIRSGWIVPNATASLLSETSHSALVSGNWSFGQVAAESAVAKLIEIASTVEIGCVGVVEVNHIGRLGRYAEELAEAGLVGMVFAGGYAEEAPTAAPYGGRGRLLQTNPLSMGFPGGNQPRMMLDFATTTLSGSKIRLARERGEAIPPGAIIDKDGVATTNPGDFFDGGAHVLFGGHKGYAISMAVEFLGRILTGSDDYSDTERGGPIMRHQGVLFVSFRADLFSSIDSYRRRVDAMVERTHACPPAPGSASVLMPGDPEWGTRQTRQRDGIPLDDSLWAKLNELLPMGAA